MQRWRQAVVVVALLVALAFVAGIPSVSADEPAPTGQPQEVHTITVVGQSETSVQPDMAQFSVGVRTVASTAQQAQSEVSTAARRLIDQLKAHGVGAGDIETSSYSLNPHYGDGSGRVDGFEADYMLRVTVRDLDALGSLLDATVASGANQIFGIQFLASNADAVQRGAYDDAVRDARRKAETLAAAAEARIVGVKDIELQDVYGPPIIYADVKQAPAAALPIQPGDQTLRTTVRVTYLIAP